MALTQQTVYAKLPDPVKRKAYQLAIARVLSEHLLGAKVNSTALVRAAGRAAGERRLMAWSSDPAVEADLEKTALGGARPGHVGAVRRRFDQQRCGQQTRLLPARLAGLAAHRVRRIAGRHGDAVGQERRSGPCPGVRARRNGTPRLPAESR